MIINLKLLILIPIFFYGLGCSDDTQMQFRGAGADLEEKSEDSVSEQIDEQIEQQIEKAENVADEFVEAVSEEFIEEGSDPTVIKGDGEVEIVEIQPFDPKLCEGAWAGNFDQVIRYDGKMTTTFEPNAVVYFEITGNARFDIPASETNKIRGLCVSSGGGSDVSVEWMVSVEGMAYQGRGNATTTFNFAPGARLGAVFPDISGSNMLELNGDDVDCSKLSIPSGGSSAVFCNGKML